jgi:hypothetical protein
MQYTQTTLFISFLKCPLPASFTSPYKLTKITEFKCQFCGTQVVYQQGK